MNMNKSEPVPKPKAKRPLFLGVVALALLGIGGLVYWQFFSTPPQPWVVKWRIGRYLKSQSGHSNFQVKFDFPSKAEMSKAISETGSAASKMRVGPLTKKDFDTLVSLYIPLKSQALVLQRQLDSGQKGPEEPKPEDQGASTNTAATTQSNVVLSAEQVTRLQNDLATKEKALEPIVSDLWAFQRAWAAEVQAGERTETNRLAAAWTALAGNLRNQFDEATSYSAMYKLIGQELWVADRLLASANIHHRRVGLGIARQAAWDAIRYIENAWLAARICEGYLLANLDSADKTAIRSFASFDNLVNECANIFGQADETANVMRTYQIMLAHAPPQRKDWARVQLAMAYERAGDFKSALRYLKAVEATNNFGWIIRRIPSLEQQAKDQR